VSRKRRPQALTAESRTLARLALSLFEDEQQRNAFTNALLNPQELAVAVVWLGNRPEPMPFPVLARPAWAPDWIDFVSIEHRPGRHALHESGAYYCLDPSSVFESQVLTAAASEACETMIDVCASPGGKTILASRILSPRGMVCNEVIRKRTAALSSNLKRCRIANASVTNCKVEQLASDYAEAADVVIVDAPCSGQSLIARGKESPGCFHPATINLNSNRQRRILAHSASIVRRGGFLAYMTCTFARKENERNLDWFLKNHPDWSAQPVPILEQHRSPFSETPCYRIWPQGGVGAGGFTAIVQRHS